MDNKALRTPLSATLLVVAPSHAAGHAYLMRRTQREPALRGLIVTPRGLRDALLGMPSGSWRALGAWEERQLWASARSDAATEAGRSDPIGPGSLLELDLSSLRWLRRAGIAPSTLAQGGRMWQLAAASLARFEALRQQHRLLDDVALERAAEARLRSGRVPAAWQSLTEARVLSSVEVHAELLRWVEALAEAKIGAGIRVTVDVAYNPDAPERTPYAQAQLQFLEHWGALLDGIEHVATLPEGKPAFAAVRAPWGEAALSWTVQQLRAWQSAGVPLGQLSVVFPRALVRGEQGREGLQLVRRLHHALRQAGLPSRMLLERGLEQPLWARRLMLGLEEARALSEGRPVRPMTLADLVAATTSDGEPDESKLAEERTALARCLRSLTPRTWLVRDIEAAWVREGGEPARAVAGFAAWREQYLEPLAQARSVAQAARLLLTWAQALGAEREQRVRFEEALAELLIAEQQAAAWGARTLGLRGIDEALRFVLENQSEAADEPAEAITLGAAESLVGRPFAASIWWGANPSLMRSQLSGAARLPEAVVDALGQLAPQALGRELRPYSSELRARWLLDHWQAATAGPRAVVFFDRGEADDAQPSAQLRADLQQLEAKFEMPRPISAAPSAQLGPRERMRELAAQGRSLPDEAWQPLLCVETHAALARRVLASRRLRERAVRLRGAAQAQLERLVLGEVHRTTLLDALAQCRFRFFAQRSLRLAEPEQLTPELSRATRGSVAHQALFFVYSHLLHTQAWPQWRDEPAACRAEGQKVINARYTDIVRGKKISQRMQEPLRSEIERIVDVQLQRDLAADDNEPVAFEYAFGSGPQESETMLEVVHPQRRDVRVRVRGSIDRIDRTRTGLTVIDYKSSLPTWVVAGRHLQLALYQLAAAQALGDANEWSAKWLKLGGALTGSDVQKKPGELCDAAPAVQERTQAALWERVDGLLAGDIAPDAPKATICERCPYPALCRYVPEPTEDDEAMAQVMS